MPDESPQPRHHAAGGWRRAMIGLALGASFGAWVTRVVPADRTWPPVGTDELREVVGGLARTWRGRSR